MISIKHKVFSQFDLTRMIMPAGSRYSIPAAENDKSIGVICLRGGTVHDPMPHAPVHLPQAGEGLLLNEARTAWSNEAAGHNDLDLLAPEDTEWVCIAENGHGRPCLAFVQLGEDGFLNVQPGRGVVVIEGNVIFDGIPGEPDDYFKPRAAPAVLTGQCKIILVTA